MENLALNLTTSLDAEELRKRLRLWEPWSIQVDFSNGVSTKDLKRRTPFSQHPLNKFHVVEKVVPFTELAGGKLLDIGCNSGYNSIHAATKYGLLCTGLDVNPRHLEVSRFFAELAGTNAQFISGSAETFSRPGEFDIVLHFGTLYHLPNPLLSLQTTFENLRPGGWLALETQVYESVDDPNLCYFMRNQNNDPTNFWALSPSVLTKSLELQGYSEVQQLLKVVPAQGLAANMSRMIVVARKMG